jgi:hypothetical protein
MRPKPQEKTNVAQVDMKKKNAPTEIPPRQMNNSQVSEKSEMS